MLCDFYDADKGLITVKNSKTYTKISEEYAEATNGSMANKHNEILVVEVDGNATLKLVKTSIVEDNTVTYDVLLSGEH